MALTLIFFLALFLIGGLYVTLASNPGQKREEAVRRIGALLWGMTIGGVIGGIAVFIGLVWFAVGGTYQLAFNSARFSPGAMWTDRLRRWTLFPYEQLVYAITGAGSFAYWP